MSHECFVPVCGRRVTDDSPWPVCGWHLFGVSFFTKNRYLDTLTCPEHDAALQQLLLEAQRDVA